MTEQGSPEWFAERCGKVTASRIADILAKTKTGHAASRANYLAQLAAERLTGVPAESYSNAAMQWGIDTEPFARASYEMHAGVLVEEVGFIQHPSIELSGASPDGLVVDDGLVEIKCPNTATHIEYLLSGSVPSKYEPQMTFQLMCTGRNWCDFVSFDPRMPDDLQLFVIRFTPTEEYIALIDTEIRQFLSAVEKTVNQLETLRQSKVQP
jgi:putative phage-type endonuclease